LQYLQNLIRQLDISSMGDAALRVVSIFICMTVHESCHGLAAYLLGDPTAKSMHRLSLNPLRHIDWFGLAMMFALGFGWAKPVPVDMRYFKNPKQGMAITALAGPLSNLVLAFALILISKGVYLSIGYSAGTEGVFTFLLTTAVLSIGLGLFNLIPIPPLDGSKVLGALLPDRAYYLQMHYERYGMLVLILLSMTSLGGGFISSAVSAVYSGMMNLIY